MNPLLIARLALGIGGIVVWGVGIRTQNRVVIWTGIGLLVLTLALRFANGKRER